MTIQVRAELMTELRIMTKKRVIPKRRFNVYERNNDYREEYLTTKGRVITSCKRGIMTKRVK